MKPAKLVALPLLVCLLASPLRAEDPDWTGDWLFQSAPGEALPVNARHRLWRDMKRKLVILDGEICLTKGPLEMLACPQGTKEHESVIRVSAIPGFVHGELVKLGAEPGAPAQFDPYQPARGTPIRVVVAWVDADGKRHAVDGRQFVKSKKTGEAMTRNWVFAGSHFIENEATGRTSYAADAGDFICVANFPTASIDLPVASSAENSELIFEAFTANIPPEKTKVRLVLIPELDPDEATK